MTGQEWRCGLEYMTVKNRNMIGKDFLNSADNALTLHFS